jgi:methyl-accepting chemotaxis protein
MRLMLRHKVIGLAVFSAAVPVLCLCLLVLFKDGELRNKVSNELDDLIAEDLRHVTQSVYSLCKTADELIQGQVDSNLRIAHKLMDGYGKIRLGPETVKWDAVNQFTLQKESVILPRFFLGSTWMGQNTTFAAQTPVVDELKELAGGTCTVFQRMNEKGDMLRVATNVPNNDKDRAIGTYIPALNPDGAPNKVVAAVLKGDTYHGPAYVVNSWYVSAYEPIRDAAGKVIGMLYVGVKQESVPILRQTIMDVKVGDGGAVYVLQGSGTKKGEVLISPKDKDDGENWWQQTDADGQMVYQPILAEAVKLKDGEVGRKQMTVHETLGQPGKVAIANFTYYPAWDWVIVTLGYEDDFYDALKETDAAFQKLLFHSALWGIGSMLLASVIALFIGSRIARPISDITDVAGMVASGDLEGASARANEMGAACSKPGNFLSGMNNDETETLIEAVGRMIDQLNSLIRQVKKSSISLISTATQIAATSRQQESSVSALGASSSEIAAAVKQISATSQELVRTVEGVTEVAADTADLADAGRTSLSGMESTMRGLEKSTGSISAKLAVISEKASNINSVITTITKVADQTNLLSLNAAIEAEKAGEYGLGFSVVAREIRRLADQTAVATLDIEQMVKEMQSSVSAGVMEMDKFSEEVRRGVADTGSIAGQLARIIAQVQVLTPRFETVTEGMQSQSKGAQQINNAMSQLTEVASGAEVSVREFNQAAQQLHDAVRALREEVSRFKVD